MTTFVNTRPVRIVGTYLSEMEGQSVLIIEAADIWPDDGIRTIALPYVTRPTLKSTKDPKPSM
jgi:hypothetical protein